MKTIKTLIFALVALMLSVPVFAQTTINSTTLGAAITDAGQTTTINLASIGSGATAVIAGQILFVDGEAMQVNTTPTAAARVSVVRHVKATPGQTHASGALVYYGNAQAFVGGAIGKPFYAGSCTASSTLYTPVVDIVNSSLGTCTNSTWTWTRLSPLSNHTYNYTPVADVAYTVLATDYFVSYTGLSAARTATIPAATGLAGKVYIITNDSTIATNTIFVSSASSINGNAASVSATIWGTHTGVPSNITGVLRLYSNGTSWFTW